MPIQVFPFSGGLNTHIDTRLLPDGALADAVNVELDREGRLVGRAKFTAQATTVYGPGALVACDLFSFNDRLFCIGDANSYGFPTDIFEYMPDGLAARWRPTCAVNATTPRLPRATQVRDIARPPDQAGGISNMGCAAMGGYAALVWNSSDNTALGYLLVVRAAGNEPVLFDKFETSGNPFSLLRVVALSDRFIILGTSNVGTDDIRATRFIPASDEAVSNLGTIVTGTIVTYAACKVAGADQFVIAHRIGTTITIRRFDNTGTLIVPSGGQYATISAAATNIAVEASSTANQIVVLLNVGGTATAYGYNLSTGATIGNAAAFSGETCVEVGLCRVSSAVVQAVASVTSETAPTVMTNKYTVSTSTFAGVLKAVTDAQLSTSPVYTTETFFGVRIGSDGVGNTPNMVVSSGTDDEEVTPQICKDLEVAAVASTLLPDIALDSSTSKYYWANATANPDGDLTPCLTEFSLTSTSRRQVTQFGNLAYIAGGTPLVFDGMSVVESGFQERPRIISLTGSDSTGELLSGGEYDYRLHWEHVDSDNNIHLSPVSQIKTVTLGSTHDTVTAVVASPHSMRRNSGNNDRGGVVRCVLSRTLGTVSHTTPTLTGTKTLDPPDTSLSGVTFKVIAVVAGVSTVNTVTFSASATTLATVVSEINTAFTNITAAASAGLLQLTNDSSGDGTSIIMLSPTLGSHANATLGFANFAADFGETTHTKGENFQRAASAFTTASAAVAAYVTVTDTKKDQSDPIVDTDLIRQQVLYSQGIASGSHHAPPPCEYIWAGQSRIVVAGQPRRSKWTASKLIVPAEPAEFAFDGFLAFSGQTTGDIEACAVVGDAVVLFTRRQIWMVTGSGPNRSGQGQFFDPVCISKTMGIIDEGWRSLVEDDQGLWFQGSDGEIYRMSGAGQIEWLGKEVQDKLASYPVITAAVFVPDKGEVAFSITNTGGSTGGILRYRSDSRAWFFDDVGAVTSMATYDGRIAYVQSGTVYIQDAAPGSGTFVPYNVTTGMFQGFQALGYGQLHQVGFLGTWRGPCTIEVFASEDGSDFTTSLGSWSLTDAEYDVGDRVRLLVQPAVAQRDSFALKYSVTYASTDSEGVWLHAAAVDTEFQPDFVRLGATHNL